MVVNLVALLSTPSLANSSGSGCTSSSHWTLLLTGTVDGRVQVPKMPNIVTMYFEVTGEGSESTTDPTNSTGLRLQIHDCAPEGQVQVAAARVVPIMEVTSEDDVVKVMAIIAGETHLPSADRTCQDWVVRMVGALGDRGYLEVRQREAVVHVLQEYLGRRLVQPVPTY